jgi:hypothetical protein
MSLPQNVVVAAIYIAICLQYQTIEVYGVEAPLHNLFVDEENQTYVVWPHFYEEEKRMGTEVVRNGWKLHEWLYTHAKAFEAYQDLQTFAEYMQTKVINYTPNTFVDAFKRGKLPTHPGEPSNAH